MHDTACWHRGSFFHGFFMYSVILVVVSCFIWLLMFSKGLGTSTSPIVIESEVEDSSPVKVVKGDKFR